MAKPHYTPGPYHTKKEFMTNRFVSAIGGNVKLDFSWADRHQIRFFFHDEPPLFGIFGGKTGNFEVFLERDKVDSMDYQCKGTFQTYRNEPKFFGSIYQRH